MAKKTTSTTKKVPKEQTTLIEKLQEDIKIEKYCINHTIFSLTSYQNFNGILKSNTLYQNENGLLIFQTYEKIWHTYIFDSEILYKLNHTLQYHPLDFTNLTKNQLVEYGTSKNYQALQTGSFRIH